MNRYMSGIALAALTAASLLIAPNTQAQTTKTRKTSRTETANNTAEVRQQRRYVVGAYLYPAYASDDERLRPFWPMGIGEWETVMTMQQRYPAH